MKKKTIIIAVLAVVALAAVAFFTLNSGSPGHQMAFETAKVEKATIGNSVTATGTIEPVTKVDVGTQVSGIISKILKFRI